MVLVCRSCGNQVKQTAKFCCECGAKTDDSVGSTATQEGAGPLISPVGEGERASALPVILCTAHPPKKAVGFCQKCQDLVCLTCVTEGPHASCGKAVSLEDLLGMTQPFQQQRTALSHTQLDRQKLLKDLQTRKSEIEIKLKAEVAKLSDTKADALKRLKEKFEAEVEKLKADCDKQLDLVEESAETKINHIEQSGKKILDDLQKRIDEISTDIHNLKAADQKLAASFSAQTLLDHVAGNQEARKLLTTSRNAPTPALLPSATANDEAELRGLADLTLEVTAKKSGAGASQNLIRDVAAKATGLKQETRSDVALTGPDAVFAVGSRVVVAPGGPSYPDEDDGGPGTITKVWGDMADVRWDAGRLVRDYCIGYNGKYHLKLVKPA